MLFALIGLVAGCHSLQFYGQAALGQLQLMTAGQPVDQLLADPRVNPELARQLALSQEILRFAAEELSLPAEGRYQRYVEIDRQYVLWNVYAAGPYSLQATRWCYPIVGCAPYRGYFNLSRAKNTALQYEAQGLETYVGGVPAYSTLGWFADPLLSTFLAWPQAELVGLLLHELAHSKVWLEGDVAFNESFASFVGQQGMYSWFEQRADLTQWQAWHSRRQVWLRFREFLLKAKAHLSGVYAGSQADLKQNKQAAMNGLQACYAAHRAQLGAGRYDRIMAHNFNNAFLISVGTYADWLPVFRALFDQSGGDWPRFFEAVKLLTQVDADDRLQQMQNLLAQQQKAQGTDDQNTKEIDCQPFLSHGFNAELAG